MNVIVILWLIINGMYTLKHIILHKSIDMEKFKMIKCTLVNKEQKKLWNNPQVKSDQPGRLATFRNSNSQVSWNKF